MKQFIASVIMFLMAGGLALAARKCKYASIEYYVSWVSAITTSIFAFIVLGVYVFD